MPMSPSSRRAWIETADETAVRADHWVALLAEGVDRNILRPQFGQTRLLGRPPHKGRGSAIVIVLILALHFGTPAAYR